MFDPGGCIGRLRGCPFLGGRHVLRNEWIRLDAAVVAEAGAFWYTEELHMILKRGQAIRSAVRIAVDCCPPKAKLI